MTSRPRSLKLPGFGLSGILLFGFLFILWIAGGASRADVLGQTIVRSAAWIVIVAALLFAHRPSFRITQPVPLLLIASILIVAVQLVPLPPGIWENLPGREPLTAAARIAGEAQPWRPLSMVPGATWNAASSLIVPLTVFILLYGMEDRERAWLPAILLGLVAASTFIGLLQFTGAGFNDPLINYTAGQVSGTFANRNHFALFVAIGLLLCPVWVFYGGRQAAWRGPVAIGLALLFALTILASGSRAGMLVGMLSFAIGLLLARRGLKYELRRAPRWVLPAAIAAMVAMIAVFVAISIFADRAESISRAVSAEAGTDMRARGLPVVLSMIQTYFPVGTGFGSFDPVFRMHEPFELLKPTYFNHAHNDFLEIILDGGVLALIVLIAAIGWWLAASWRAWRSRERDDLARLGSAILLAILLASGVDYPVRTPMMMALIVIAATWLGGAARPALPTDKQQL